MRVHSILPLVPFLACAGLTAVELGPDGLFLDGYVEAFTKVDQRQGNHPRNLTASGDDETAIAFPANLGLQLRYSIDAFTLRSDVIVSNKTQFDNDHVLLEQAFIDWQATEILTVRAGRSQTTWLAWEGFHTQELFRVNHSAAWDWNVKNHSLGPQRPFVSDGIGIIAANADRTWTAEFHIADDLLGNGPDSTALDKAVGGCVTWTVPNLGRLEVGVGFDPKSTLNGQGGSDDAYALEVNYHLNRWLDAGWFFAFECQIHRHPDLNVDGDRYGNDLVALAMANYTFLPGTASLTVMLDYVERGFAAKDNEIMEYAVAILTRPHPQVRLNAEVFYWDEAAANADSFGAAAVVLMKLP